MVLGVLNGLLVAIALTIALLLRSLARPRLSTLGRVGEHDYVNVTRFPAAKPVPGMVVLRLEEPMFFANAEPLLAQVRERVRDARASEAHALRVVVVSLEESPDLDSTSLEALGELCSWLAAHTIELRLARLKDLARDALARANLKHLSASALHYASVDDAVRGQCVVP
jgi:MFS superfamily sulfate permease-like transporter